jgi:hypothetical protein
VFRLLCSANIIERTLSRRSLVVAQTRLSANQFSTTNPELLRVSQSQLAMCPSASRQLILVFDDYQWFLARRFPFIRHFNDQSFKLVFWSVDYWLIWQFLRWFIPRSSLFDSTRECLCNQSTDFLPL